MLISSTIVTAYADPIRTSDNQKKRQLFDTLSDITKNHYCDIGKVWIQLKNTTGALSVYNSSSWCGTSQTPPPPPPVEICGNGIDDDKDGQIDEGCPVSSIPKLNKTTTLRIALVGDIDDNSGLVTQVNLAKKHGAEYFVVPGDFAYDSASGVKSKVSAVYPASKVIMAVGNHDSASFVKSWMGTSTSYYERYVGDQEPNTKVLQFIVADSNTGFGCSGTQFNQLKANLEDSDAWYKVFVLHHPFATVQSNHGPNGQFNCFNTLFQNNGVDLVAQAHNHNFQWGSFGKSIYGVFGTGTHDTGSAMYDCDSSTFNSVNMHCQTGTNGVTFVDFKVDKFEEKEKYYFVSNADKLVTSWSGN